MSDDFVLDADIVIKSAVCPSEKALTLLEKIVDIPGDFYIHNYVYKEVQWPESTVKLLSRLVDEGKIKLLGDEVLLSLWENTPFPAVRKYLDTLQQCCMLFGKEAYYDEHYSSLERYVTEDISAADFGNQVARVDQELLLRARNDGKATHLGEIKTAAMIESLNSDSIVFVSDDRRARNIIVSDKIRALSTIGTFYFLMTHGMFLDDARLYAESLGTKEFKIQNSEARLTGIQVVDGMHDGTLVLLKNGEIKRK